MINFIESILSSFRSDTYSLEKLNTKWYSVIKNSGFLFEFEDRVLL